MSDKNFTNTKNHVGNLILRCAVMYVFECGCNSSMSLN
jgi:hypothetical protein